MEKKIRLIQLFAGYGSQAMALKRAGIPYEDYCISEWDVNATKSYKMVHSSDTVDYSFGLSKEDMIEELTKLGISSDGKRQIEEKTLRRKREEWLRETYNNYKQTNNLGSIVNIHGGDLKICDTDQYLYFMTYSFPCQSLSLQGKQDGMAKGSGTTSSLLWEIERILYECNEEGNLPQILFMENVTQVHNEKNMPDFQLWLNTLEELGYKNFYADLNAMDYNVPQSRKRCFMFSFLQSEFGKDIAYTFPKPIPLTKHITDYLEEKPDESHYIKIEQTQRLISKLIMDKKLSFLIASEDNSCIAAMRGRYKESYIARMVGRNPENPTSRQPGLPTEQRLEPNAKGICNTLTSVSKDNLVIEKRHTDNNLEFRLRNLTPVECYMLMGVERGDAIKMSEVNTVATARKQTGNSIVVDVMVEIFKRLPI